MLMFTQKVYQTGQFFFSTHSIHSFYSALFLRMNANTATAVAAVTCNVVVVCSFNIFIT